MHLYILLIFKFIYVFYVYGALSACMSHQQTYPAPSHELTDKGIWKSTATTDSLYRCWLRRGVGGMCLNGGSLVRHT